MVLFDGVFDGVFDGMFDGVFDSMTGCFDTYVLSYFLTVW